jgi:hypothetical protein
MCLFGCLESTPAVDIDSVATQIEQAVFGGDLGAGLGSPLTTDSTVGKANDHLPSCVPSSNAPDITYTWTAPSAGNYTFSTFGSSFDTVLEIRNNKTSASLGCNDDSGGTVQSTVVANMSSGQTVLVVIDGYGLQSGSFQLSITGGSTGPATGAHLWLRADAGVSLAGSTQAVAQWIDQSGNGRNASMTNPARRPQLVAGALNGLPVIRFAGAQSMYLDTFATPTLFTVFVVGKNSMSGESFSMILGPGGNSPNNQLRWENSSQTLFVGTGNNLPVVTSSTGNTRVYHSLSARYDGGVMTVYRDGNITSSSAFSTTGPWTLASIGSWYSSEFLVGDLAEVLIYDRAMSETERVSVNAYLRGKYNLP